MPLEITREIIQDAHSKSKNAKQLSKELGCSHSAVLKWAERYEMPFKRLRKHNGNLPAFQNITNAEIAYIMGYLWADGHVTKYTVRIALVKEDGEHLLDLIKKHCKVAVYRKGATVTDCSRQAQVNMIINDTELSHYFASLGYREKSRISPIKVLESIPKGFHPAFWLGYHDGDGHYDPKKNRCGYSSTINQDWSALENLCLSMNVKWSIRTYVHPSKPHSFSEFMIYGIYPLRRFLGYLYRFQGLGLPRKYKKYAQMMVRPWKPEYQPPTDPVLARQRELRNERKRLARQASRQKADKELSLMAT